MPETIPQPAPEATPIAEVRRDPADATIAQFALKGVGPAIWLERVKQRDPENESRWDKFKNFMQSDPERQPYWFKDIAKTDQLRGQLFYLGRPQNKFLDWAWRSRSITGEIDQDYAKELAEFRKRGKELQAALGPSSFMQAVFHPFNKIKGGNSLYMRSFDELYYPHSKSEGEAMGRHQERRQALGYVAMQLAEDQRMAAGKKSDKDNRDLAQRTRQELRPLKPKKLRERQSRLTPSTTDTN